MTMAFLALQLRVMNGTIALDHLKVISPKDGTIERFGPGIGPLLRLYLEHPSCLEGAEVFDKVIGKAAASILVLGKAKCLKAHLLSEQAIPLLKEAGIAYEAEIIAPNILNHAKSGLCPMELSAQFESEAGKILEKVKQKAKELGII